MRDLTVAPLAVNRFDLKSGNAIGGIHVQMSLDNPEEIEILFSEPPGVPLDGKTARKIENHYFREDFRRASFEEMGSITFPPRLLEQYLEALLETWDVERIRQRHLRVVVDYAHGPASILLTTILDQLGTEIMTVNSLGDNEGAEVFAQNLPAAVERARRLVAAMEADLGLIFDPGGEQLIAVDERGERVADDALLLLLLRHACTEDGPGVVVLPLPVTKRADEIAAALDCTVRRTKSSDAALMAEATRPGAIFAASLGGGFIFPAFLPSMDAVLIFGKVLEVLASSQAPFSSLVGGDACRPPAA